MAAFSSSAISAYSIAGGIDLRSGAPVAIDGSQTGLTVGSANVTDGVFNGSSSWVSLGGIDLSSTDHAAVTAIVNVPGSPGNPTQVLLWEYGADALTDAGSFRTESTYATNVGLQMLARSSAADGYAYIGMVNDWNAGGDLILHTQYDISASPYPFTVARNGSGNTTSNASEAKTVGVFGNRTLYVGASSDGAEWLTGTISFLIVHEAAQDATAIAACATALADPDTLLESVATSNYYIGADITPGNWTTSTGSGTLTSMVSETSRDDTQYIQSAVNPSADLVELEWANVQIPSVNTNHTVSYVLKGDASCQALVALLAGDATTVTAWVHTALPPTFQRFDQELSTAAADAWSVGGYAGSHLTVTAG